MLLACDKCNSKSTEANDFSKLQVYHDLSIYVDVLKSLDRIGPVKSTVGGKDGYGKGVWSRHSQIGQVSKFNKWLRAKPLELRIE